jgi:hypothetical protein
LEVFDGVKVLFGFVPVICCEEIGDVTIEAGGIGGDIPFRNERLCNLDFFVH